MGPTTRDEDLPLLGGEAGEPPLLEGDVDGPPPPGARPWTAADFGAADFGVDAPDADAPDADPPEVALDDDGPATVSAAEAAAILARITRPGPDAGPPTPSASPRPVLTPAPPRRRRGRIAAALAALALAAAGPAVWLATRPASPPPGDAAVLPSRPDARRGPAVDRRAEMLERVRTSEARALGLR